MSNDEAIGRARVELAAALRWAARLGFSEGVCNHFSVSLPGAAGRFLVNPQGLHWSEVRPRDILTVDGSGRVLEGGHTVEPTAFMIHSAIHGARPDARCVLHSHMPFATTLTLLEGARLDPVSQNALRYYGRVAYDEDYNGLALDEGEGARIAGKLGMADVMFMANHGVIVCGASVAWAFDDLYYLERACMLQVLGQGTGKLLRRVPHAVASATARQFAADRGQSDLHFAALMRLLDREEPGWSALE